MTRQPMTAHNFPWPHRSILVAVFDKDNPDEVYVLRCQCAEHGALFTNDGDMLSIHEHRVIPFAWKVDDVPTRDDSKWPPLWWDYLTAKEEP